MTSMIKKPDAEFGKALISAARETHQENSRQIVLSQVSKLFSLIEKCEEYREKLGDIISLSENQMKAVELGEFTISQRGLLSFNDKSLNIGRAGNPFPSIDASFCPHCGKINTEAL